MEVVAREYPGKPREQSKYVGNDTNQFAACFDMAAFIYNLREDIHTTFSNIHF